MAVETFSDVAVAPLRTWRESRAGRLLGGVGLLKESWTAMIGLAIVVFWVAMAILAPWISPYAPNVNDFAALAQPKPSAAHWLGVDHLGRDILSRLLWGARTVLTVAPIAVVGATLLGSILGLAAGYYRGLVDLAITRVCDIVLSFPVIILYMIVLALFGATVRTVRAPHRRREMMSRPSWSTPSQCAAEGFGCASAAKSLAFGG